MTTRHDLPSGAWVEIRDYRELTGRDVKQVMAAVTGRGAQWVVDQRAALLEILVENWSYDYRLPASSAVTDLLRADDYVALQELMSDGYNLVNGISVIPDSDDHADPTPPTQDGNE
jgi:hypothetical protein